MGSRKARRGYSKEGFWSGAHPSVLSFHTILLCHANFKEHYWQGCSWCTIWSLLKCVLIHKWLLGRFCLGVCFRCENTEKLHISFTDTATHMLLKMSFPLLAFLFPYIHLIKSPLRFPHCFPEAVSLRYPKLVASVPKLGVPREEMHTCAVVLKSSPRTSKSDWAWMWLNVTKYL